MNYRQLIQESWELTQTEKPLMWWYAFFPELIGFVVGIFYLTYQVMSFWKSPIFHEYQGESFAEEVISLFVNFFSAQPSLGIVLIVGIAVWLILYFTLPVFSKGALVELIARQRNGQEAKVVEGVSYGFLHFLPLFEYRLLIRTFSVFGVLTEVSFVVRNLGTGALELLIIPFILIFLIGLLLMLVLTYSEYFMIIDDKKVLAAMGASVKLVVRHWQHTILMLILMALITLRIVLNIVLVLLIPAIIIVSTGLLATFALAKLGMVLGILVGLVGLYFSAYLGAILEVFSTSVWVFTFLELTSKEELPTRQTVDA